MRSPRIIAISLGCISIAALSLASMVEFAPRLVWNASASAPIGLYIIERHSPETGDYVLLEAEDELGEFITDRGYLPPEIPLLKRVAALAGDEICREGEAIFIDKIRVADALLVDSHGRKLPAWEGCFSLSARQFFFLNDPKNSLDGRYFGATDADEVLGVAVPLWTRRSAR